MRKIATIALLILSSLNIHAQSLMDLFNSSSSNSTTAEKKTVEFKAASILGEWSYTKLAAGLTEDSPLKGLAGDVALAQATNMLNSISSSAGITPGAFSATFNRSGSLILVVKGVNYKSKYTVDPTQESVQLEIGQIEGVDIGTLDAKVTLYSNSVTLLFDAKVLMSIADKLPSIVENSQYQMIRGLVSKIDGLLFGFELEKQ